MLSSHCDRLRSVSRNVTTAALNGRTWQEEYVREGIEWEHVEFFDNSVICDLVERNNCGLISLLDEAAMRKQPLAGFFMSQSTDGEQSPAALSAGFLDRAGHVHEQGGAVAFKLHNSLRTRVGLT